MTEQTQRALRQALKKEAQAKARAEELQQDCLSGIASHLSARLDDLAKGIAHAQPGVTKALGKDGVARLRADLAEAAAALSGDIEQAGGRIAWPDRPFSSLSPIDTRNVHEALFKYLHGKRLRSIVEVFRKHGYDVQDNNAQRAPGIVVPQNLYNEKAFADLAEALQTLAEARQDTARARSANDHADVDDLWDD
jgi:hypothetical protein